MEKQNNIAKKKTHKLVAILSVVTAGIVVAVVWPICAVMTGVFSMQWFGDQITVATYRPTMAVAELAEGSGMSDKGRFYFYAATPQIDDRENFNVNCADVMGEGSYTLGCYDGQIFLFDVTDDRISGVKYVTAAHEMLHAAYDRLGLIEKSRVDTLLREQLDRTTDQRILDLVSMYAQTEPGQELNELHSIFGSEVVDLSSGLAEYYGQYFDERSKTTSASEKYEAVFAEMERRADELDDKMTALEIEIEVMSDKYNADAEWLSNDIDKFNALASIPGGFASEAAFGAQRSSLLSRKAQLDAVADTINAKIDEYNRYVTELQTLGREAEALQNSIDSRATMIE